jgi:hypothetical protein
MPNCISSPPDDGSRGWPPANRTGMSAGAGIAVERRWLVVGRVLA